MVKAGRKRNARFKGYCTQADLINPRPGSTFDLKIEREGKLHQLADFLKDIEGADEAAQHAVWALTDDHDLKGLHHPELRKAIAIQRYVAQLTGKPMPRYTVRYRPGHDGQAAFTGEVVTIHGIHEYDIPADAHFTCKIYNEAGEEVQVVFDNMLQKKGHARFTFKLEAANLPRGRYVSRVFQGEELFQEIWLDG